MDYSKGTQDHFVFFLGGYDLEMATIREILEEKGCRFRDRRLQWNQAKCSAYSSELATLPKDDIPVFIELEMDLDLKNGVVIDHHGEKAGWNKLTSIEQIANILGIKLNRQQELVAANDRGHIRGMKTAKATADEINQIRMLDRRAQGVSEADEQRAQEAVQAAKVELNRPNNPDYPFCHDNSVIFVRSSTSQTSPIVDRLCSEHRHIFIYAQSGHFYYSGSGWIVDALRNAYRDIHDSGVDADYWFGGGLPEYGYFGSNSLLSVEKIKALFVQSQHIFMFPFRFTNDPESTSDEIDQKFKESLTQLGWQSKRFNLDKSTGVSNDELRANYSEYYYFHPFVRDSIFQSHAQTECLSMCEYFEWPLANDSQMKLHIAKTPDDEAKNYCLSIHHLSLRLFQSGVGVLTIELLNYDTASLYDVRLINDFGRRIYPQFLSDAGEGIGAVKKAFLCDSIEFCVPNLANEFGKEEFLEEKFLNGNQRFASYIEALLGIDNIKTFEISPIIDDRMYCLTWFGNDFVSGKMCSPIGHDLLEFETNSDWLKFLLVDGRFAGFADEAWKKRAISDLSYRRWADYGTLFGISRYSFVCLTDRGDFGTTIIRHHMERHYYQMTVVLLAQRATLLKFSNDASLVGREVRHRSSRDDLPPQTVQKVIKLQSDFMYFVNRLWFTEISPQEQGIDLYELAQRQMGLDRHFQELQTEIKELRELVTLMEDRTNTRRLTSLNLLAGYLLPITTALGIWGANLYFINILLPTADRATTNEKIFHVVTSISLATLTSVVILILCKRLFVHNKESDLADRWLFKSTTNRVVWSFVIFLLILYVGYLWIVMI